MSTHRKDSRVFFPKGEQQKLMEQILSKISVAKAARIAHLSERTIRDWRREQLSMEYAALRALCHYTKTPLPKSFSVKDKYWYTAIGAKKGARAVLKKYGRVGGADLLTLTAVSLYIPTV